MGGRVAAKIGEWDNIKKYKLGLSRIRMAPCRTKRTNFFTFDRLYCSGNFYHGHLSMLNVSHWRELYRVMPLFRFCED
jgi:hypothetical protein